MKRLLLSISIITCSLYALPAYNSVAVYAMLTYGMLSEYEKRNPGCSSDLIQEYLHSSAFKHLRADAYNMGYGWHRVLRAAYRIGIDENVQRVPILEALNKEMRATIMWKDAKNWVSFVGASFSTLVSFISLGCLMYYLRYDREVINHYRYHTLGGKFPRLYQS